MLIECGSLELAQARLQARHGQRVDEAAWRRIEVMRELAPMLELARGTALRPWLVGINADSSAHPIETSLRGHWQALVAELAGWMPAAWRPAIDWCAWLPDLAPLQHLARGRPAAHWMSADPRWQALAAAAAAARPGLLRKGPLGALAPAWGRPQDIGPAWLAEWLRRLPTPPGAPDDPLALLLRLLREHHAAFGDAGQGQGWLMRAALQARLVLLLRRATLQPAAAFIHLALSALDLERLRAELLRRAVFARWRLA